MKRKKLPKVGGDKFTGMGTPYAMKYSGNQVDRRPFRNKRSVWSIPTSQFPDAHFAVFPPALIQTPIKASCPKQVCLTCGKPRVAKYKRTMLKEPRRYGKKTSDKGYGLRTTETGGLRVDDWTVQFVGYTGCECANYAKGIVLDPFIGSGTTALVAKALGRDWVGIELSEEYINMAYKRLTQE